jgi:acetoin utilization deacetylase AcuC-like enzyme
VIPVLREFRPHLVLVSAGFDAHENDPLAGMRMTTAGYEQLSARLMAAADELCDGRIVFVTEGGYDTSALAHCAQRVIEAAAAPPESLSDAPGDTRRGEEALAEFRRAHRA